MKLNKTIWAAVFAAMAVAGCSDDDATVDPQFRIEGDISAISQSCDAVGVGSAGYIDRSSALKYVVRSNTHWTVKPTDPDADWVVIHPNEGWADGTFYVGLKENEHFDPRSTSIQIEVDGEATPRTIPVAQGGAEPYIKMSNSVTVNGAGGASSLAISANIGWTCELLDPDNGWLSIASFDETSITINAQRREEDAPRSTDIAIICPQVPEVNGTITVTQFGPSVIFYEDFEWLGNYATNGTWYDSSSPKAITSWTMAQYKMGWTSWIGTSNTTNVYGGSLDGNGWLKLGKTNYCGNAVSPALVNIGAGNTVDIDVSMVACPYVSGGNTTTNPGNHDVNNLYVGVYGPGEVVGADFEVVVDGVVYVANGNWQREIGADEAPEDYFMGEAAPDMVGTYKVKKFVLVNYPNSKNTHVWFYPDPLNCPEAECNLKVRGATADTHIIIFGGGYDDDLYGIAQTKYTITGLDGKEYTGTYADNINRVFVDNVVVKLSTE